MKMCEIYIKLAELPGFAQVKHICVSPPRHRTRPVQKICNVAIFLFLPIL